MAILDARNRLTKELTLFHVYALATGATLSSGLFLLPGLVASDVGPAVVLSYLLAALPLIPAMLSVVELSTAMPRAGGAYYFLDRSLGPMAGTIGGLGTWLALTLKTAFALIGMGAYLRLYLPDVPDWLTASAFAVFFGGVNLAGSKRAGGLQSVLVIGLLVILGWFTFRGLPDVRPQRFENFLGAGWEQIMATSGAVYISYVGVTKVASVSEEVKNPERNLPLGLSLALVTAVLVYVLCIVVMTGTVAPDVLAGNMTPMAAAAEGFAGRWGMAAITLAAILAFSSVANAGILSSSRYPLAMSRDHILPGAFRVLTKRRTPAVSIVVTVAVIIAFLFLLDPLKIAKLASAFQLLMFGLLCLAVIVMRESEIESYDPGFRSPFYPWMQIAGMVLPCFLIAEMGWMPIVFSVGMLAVGLAWYFGYAANRVSRHGAIYHVFERLGRRRFEDLDSELRGILKEKGLREHDPFVEVVARSDVITADAGMTFEEVVDLASSRLAGRVPHEADELARSFLEGTRIGVTPVSRGVALPHLRVAGIDAPSMVIVRSMGGIEIHVGRSEPTQTMAIFFLVSPQSDPGQHLRLLAELASRVDQDDFLGEWNEALDEQRLKEILLHHERYLTLSLGPGLRTEVLIDRAIRELDLPEGCLVAVVRRRGRSIVPGGDTMLRAGDQLTVIGSESAVRACSDRYGSDLPERGAAAP